MSEVITFGVAEKADPRKEELAEMQAEEVAAERAAKTTNLQGAQAALALKLAGASYVEIAKTLEYNSPRDAQHAVERALAAAVGDDEQLRTQRAMVSLQLDRIIRNHAVQSSDKKNPDQIAHSRTVLSALDRKARLLGLDAPILIQHIDPAGDEFNRLLEVVAGNSGIALPVEADIFEAESDWVEDAEEVTDA